MEQHARPNRLANDPSPYLQQHGYNPVDWYPWGQEAFDAATREDKPIFLSIGYSTCHWCHVMAHESFEDESVAAIMNKYYINIKVDREARPDLDEIYITAVQAISGSAGWPLSVFLTPQGKPFYGGSYFPPRDSMGRPGFKRVLETIADAWQKQRKQLIESAAAITVAISSHKKESGAEPDLKNLDDAFAALADSFDEVNGGFGREPKFPSPPTIEFLLAYWHRGGHEKALRMAAKTLESIAAGGITDQIGGGIHRYVIDNAWLVPHFEKMLYDQALVCINSLHLYQITRNSAYAEFARAILGYVLRDLSHPGGGFYSGEDADSPGGEGQFYIWDANEIDKILGTADAAVFNYYYGVTQDGNFQRKNILHVNAMLMDLEDRFDLDPDQALGLLEECRRKLFEVRSSRPRPLRDEKIITSWNCLMINAIALGSVVLKDPVYSEAAQRGAKFIFDNLYKDGRLMRYWRNGSAYESGVLEDYASMTLAMVELYQATFDIDWLVKAIDAAHVMCELFEDKAGGGFFFASRKTRDLIANPKPCYDGAVPSGNSLAMLAMAKLSHLTGDDYFLNKYRNTLKAFAGQLAQDPASMCAMLLGENLMLGPSKQIVISGNRDDCAVQEMLDYLHAEYMPDAMVALNDRAEVADVIPYTKDMKIIPSRVEAYVCSNYTCKEPVTELGQLKELLNQGTVISARK